MRAEPFRGSFPMTHEFPTTSWLRAESLRERVERRRRSRAVPQVEGFDAETARRELESWRSQAPFDRGDWFARRLALDGVSEDELCALIGEDVAQVEASTTPSWAAEVASAYASAAPAAPWSVALDGESASAKTLGFLNVAEPLIRRGRDRLLQRVRELVRKHPRAPVDAERVTAAWLSSLPWSLHLMLSRALVLELNVARVEGRLAGPSSEARFEDFLRGLRDPERALAFWAEYPVLARLVVRAIGKWERCGAEFLGHLCEDWESIRGTFDLGSKPGTIERIDGGAGDAHRDGRAVLVAHFESGARLVYKPRSLAVDVHFQELLERLNRAGDHPPLRRLAVLDRGDHGWVEFVSTKPCTTREEVRRFYRRQGGFVALLYVLEAIDFHYENVIASGEDPVLVDLESLFHARVGRERDSEPDLLLVSRAIARSVLRIGILPQRSFATDEYQGIDLSGLVSAEGQLTPDRVLQWDGLATDEMHARRERMAMPGGKNLPELLGSDSSVVHFKADLLQGFTEIYRLLMRHRTELLADDGWLSRFADDEVRCVLRATRGYGVLLQESFHPDYQRDALELERFLDRLWLGVEDNEYLAHVIAHERVDLANGDVPLFTTRPGARDLWSSRGERIAGYLDRSGLELVRDRVRDLSEEDLGRQLWLVQASLATLEISRASLEWAKYPAVAVEQDPDPSVVRRRMIEQARAVGDRLIERSLSNGRDVAWMGLQYDDKTWSLVPLLEDLYSGVPGIIHFLAYLGSISGEPRYTQAARSALSTYLRRLEFTRPLVRAIGAFNGWGGAIYVLSHWGRLWNDAQLHEHAHAIAARIDALVDQDEHLDVVGGCAGLVAALAVLHEVSPREQVTALARRAGDRIVERARAVDGGIGWHTRIETEVPITGFSHGAAGISWSLSKLFRWTGDERYRDAAVGAVIYERSRLVEREGNWLETTREKLALAPEARGDGALSVAWCYGAPGVGLGRLRSLGVLDHPFVREDVDIALRTTLARGFGRNHSLCHGDLGNLDFVMQAASALGDARLDELALRVQATVLASIEANGWLCGVPLAVESPSLMNGLAGIGYGLLRAAYPDRVPSVLALDPPRAS